MSASRVEGTVTVIGSGKIGQSWAILFAGAGLKVRLHDVSQDRIDTALKALKASLLELEGEGLLRGSLSRQEQAALITGEADLAKSLKGVLYVQECVFEDVELKQRVLGQMDGLLDPQTVVASSTSTIQPSLLSEKMGHRGNFLVAHPINPPNLCPLVELVPAPWTDKAAVDRCFAIMEQAGQKPIRLSREVPGFAVNRLQYAIAAEAWNMVRSGLLSPGDVDKVVSEGLGMRWAFLGPLEVMHLNANGLSDHNSQYGAGFKRVVDSYAAPPDIRDDDIQRVAREFESTSDLAERRAYRDKALMELTKLKKKLSEK